MNIINRINMLLKDYVLHEDISTWTRAIRFYKKKKKNKVNCKAEKEKNGYIIMTHFDQNVVEIGAGKTDNKYPVHLTGKKAEKTFFSDKEKAEAFAKELENGINKTDSVGIGDVFKKLKKKYNL